MCREIVILWVYFLDVLCATRRSAGLPHFIASILAKEPIANDGWCLRTTMVSLLENKGKTIESK